MNILYLVIYVNDLEASRVFYESIGFDCIKEKHGSGPVHYSMAISGIVVELYPKGRRDISRIRLGINTKNHCLKLANYLSNQYLARERILLLRPIQMVILLK